jgi:hypothetical protein
MQYEDSALRAIRSFSPYQSTHEKFIKDLSQAFADKFVDLLDKKNAKAMHRRQLLSLPSYFARIKTNSICLCCLLYTPEKVLDCGHAICDNCIKVFGSKSSASSYTYSLPSCLICEKPHMRVFNFIPPTAGARILTLDGGGIRGIITLIVLTHLEQELSYLGCHLWDCFDLVIGTSSGMYSYSQESL